VVAFSVSLLVLRKPYCQSELVWLPFWASVLFYLYFNLLFAAFPGFYRGISCLYVIQHLLAFCRSKDLLMRVVALNMSPELTLVDKVVPLSLCVLLLRL
jgi:hypothetical protein